jgi:hypothetical protein
MVEIIDPLPATVYILGGLPRTGKTTLSSEIARELNVHSMETDHIRTLFNAKPRNKISYERKADIPEVTRKLRPYLEALLTGMCNSDIGYVLNGEAIDPYMIADSPLRGRLRACFLGLTDETAAFDRIRTATEEGWTVHHTDTQLRTILGHYALRSEVLRDTCLQLELPYVDASADIRAAQAQTRAALGLPAIEPRPMDLSLS